MPRRYTHLIWISFAATAGVFGTDADYALRNVIEDKIRKMLQRRGVCTGHGQGMGELNTSFRIEKGAVDDILPLLDEWPEGNPVRVRISRIEGFRKAQVKHIPERWLIRGPDGTWSDNSAEAEMAQQEKDREALMERIMSRSKDAG
jgi:hypothetical protein